MRDYYRILGIHTDAKREEIRDAWNFSVKAFHPDKFAGSSARQQALAQERTKVINEAYAVLSDPVKRANYDWQYARERSAHAATPPPPPPPPAPKTARPAQKTASHQRKRSTVPRKPICNFARTAELLRKCVRSFARGVANIIRRLRANIIGIATFFASLIAKMSKVSGEAFRWFYLKRKLLTGGVILLLVGVGVGSYLSSDRRASWDELRRVFTNVASSSSTTFARLWRSPAKTMMPSPSPTSGALTLGLSSPNASLIGQLLREGKELREHGDTTNALARLQEALDVEPDNTGVLEEMAQTYESMQLLDRANDLWRRIKQISPSDSETYALADRRLKVGGNTVLTKAELEEMYDTAYLAFDAGNFSEALKQLDAIDARQPDLAASKNLRGVILMRQGNYDEAEAATTEAARIDPKFWNARFNLAEIRFLKKDWAEARKRFEQLLSTGQSDLAKEASQLIQYKILLTYLMEGKSDMVDSILAKLELSPDTPAVDYVKAAVALQQKNEGEAKDWISAAEKNYSPQLNKLFAESLYEVGWMEKPAGERRASLPLMTAAERTEKTKALARSKFEQSQQAFRQRDFATALKLIDESDKADPNQPATLNLRGEILMQQGKFDDAETAFKKAAKLDPKLRDAQYNLAQIPFKKKDYAQAQDRFETLYKRIPGGEKNQAAELIKFKIYMTLLMEGKESRAHSMMEEFQFTSDTPALYYAQAAWEYKHNNPQKAEDWTNSANKIYSPALNSVFADAFYDVGWLQRPQGTTAPAVAFDTSNVAAPGTESASAVDSSPIRDKIVDANKQGQTLALASPPTAPVDQHEEGSSWYLRTAPDFAKYAMNLREQGMAQVPPLIEPTTTTPNLATQRYPWKTNIVTTVFWVGEKGNERSVWDANWVANYGGIDNPDDRARRNYIPIAFVPRQNPFYCALPYNDVAHGQFKPEAPLVIPWFKQADSGPGQSVCRHRWLAIRKGYRVCYAEWEDCGPFRTNHFQYVFGEERPKPNPNHGTGLNVSPAVRDYLGLAPTDVTDWQFVEVRDVPAGPWRTYGDNNHFVLAHRQLEQRSGPQKSK